MGSVAAPQLGCHRAKAATGDTYIKEHGWAPIKLSLQAESVNQMWPMDHCLHSFTHYCEMPFEVFCPFFFQWDISLSLPHFKWFIRSKGFVLLCISFRGYGLPFSLVHCVF